MTPKDTFISKAIKTHGNKYNYSKVVYNGVDKKVIITCPIHGDFEQTPYVHLKGHGCRHCGFEATKSKQRRRQDEFINKAKDVHGDRYDYSKVEYVNSNTKVIIVCGEHGDFLITPSNHLRGKGCPKCSGRYKTTEDFIKQAKNVHGDKYDYSNTIYVDHKTKVCIICPEHGVFLCKPANHISGKGCPYCNGGIPYTREIFIEKANVIHGNRYDYSKVEYTKSNEKVCIICPIHGEFWQTPADHLQGKGCLNCGIDRRAEADKYTKEEFIAKAREIHGYKYDYSKVEYVNSQTPILLACPKHGEFWQIPNNHLRGKGCPVCRKNDIEYCGIIYTEVVANSKIFARKEHFKSNVVEWLKDSNNFYHVGVNIVFDGRNINCLKDDELNYEFSFVRCFQIPSFISFGFVECNFTLLGVNGNNLIGCPNRVNGNFICSGLHLTSFEGMPKFIGGLFDFSNNDLTDDSWEYVKDNIDGEFTDYNNRNNKFLKYRSELY